MKSYLSAILSLILLGSFGLSGNARAELDPELAAASPKNVSGFYLGPKMSLGLATPTSPGSNGFTLSLGGSMGVNISQGLWGVWQVGADFDLSRTQFRTGSGPESTRHALASAGLGLRTGYGNKIGSDIFGLFSLGIGPAMTQYAASTDELTAKSDSPLPGYFVGLGYDLVYRAAEYFNLGFGYHYDFHSYDIDELKVDGQKTKIGESLQFNTHTIQVKLALQF